jgi:DNA-binding HxlR family transcriptional regulator
LTGSSVNGDGNGARSGAQALSLLADPLNVQILRSLSAGPKRQVELRGEAGAPAQSTLRSHLRGLEGTGAIAKHRRNAFPGALEYELEGPGRELLFAIATLERWLTTASGGPLELGSDAAKAAIKALVEGWSSMMLRALAAGPLTLTELDGLIGALNYPSLERRLGAMRLVGQVKAMPNGGRGTPYAVTVWLRRGVAPIVAASRWERRNLPAGTAPIGHLDAEATLLLAVPLLRLPDELSGACRLAMELRNGYEGPPAGVTVGVEDGRIVSCVTEARGGADAWATGSATAWFRAVIEADHDQLEVGGDCHLARALLEGLYGTLFGAGKSERSQASL